MNVPPEYTFNNKLKTFLEGNKNLEIEQFKISEHHQYFKTHLKDITNERKGKFDLRTRKWPIIWNKVIHKSDKYNSQQQ